MALGGALKSALARLRRRRALVSLLVAIAIVLAVFPEVVFLGGSLSPVGSARVVNPQLEVHETVSLVPGQGQIAPRDRIHDVGASLWQLVPSIEFMRRSISDGESPFWNPYSAAGSYGPETLADMKLAPFTLATAALGGDSDAFTLVLLLFLLLALYCLQQLFVSTLGQPRVAAVAACTFFLLGGWAVSYATSAMGAPYVLAPVVLYTLVELLRRPAPARLLASVAAYAAMVMTTFLPVAFLMLLFVHVVALTLDQWWRRPDSTGRAIGRAARLLGRQAVVPALALAATAFVWVPAAVALTAGGGDLAQYADRVLPSKPLIEWTSLLSPFAFEPDRDGDIWTVTIGAILLVLVVAALPRARGLVRRLLIVTSVLALVALTQHLGVPGAKVLSSLPGLRSLRPEYWASLACAGLTVSIGCATATAARQGLSARAGTACALVLGAGWTLALATHGLGDGRSRSGIASELFWIAAAIVLLVMAARRSDRRMLFAWLAVGALALELVSYQGRVRVKRVDVEDALPGYIAFLQANVGDGRVLNIGRGALYPEWGAALGLREISTSNTTQIPEYREFYDRYVFPVGGDLLLNVDARKGDFDADPSALDLLGVRYLVVDPPSAVLDDQVASRFDLAYVDEGSGIKVYENPSAFPRAFLSPALDDRPLPEARDHAWSTELTLTSDERLLADAAATGIPTSATEVGPGDASITADHHDRVEVEVDARRPAILVLADSYQSDWRVRVNGEPAHLARVDGTLRGVAVPAGSSTVVFTYRNATRPAATLVSLVSILLLLAGSGVWAVRRRRSDAANDRPELVRS